MVFALPKVTRLTLLIGAAVLSYQSLAQETQQPQYDIVLGSYQSRTIALRELVEFSACKQPLKVTEVVVDDALMLRVIDGPFLRFDEAEIVRGKWLECGFDSAWISRSP